MSKTIKNLIFIVTLIVVWTAVIFFDQRITVGMSKTTLDDYYYDVNLIERNELGLFSKANTDYILKATNKGCKEKILELISNHNQGKDQKFDGDFRRQIEKLLNDTKTIFIGDSNVKHFSYYDLLDEKYYIEFEGKDIKKQNNLIGDKVDNSIKNIIIFNGYNLDEFEGSEDYINAYNNLINEIIKKTPDVNIFICSLIPATKEIIREDLESPLPHKIYLGKEFDIALENYKFDKAMYVDTKWLVNEKDHKEDGVHMNKDFYEIFIPYLTYFSNLYNPDNHFIENVATESDVELYVETRTDTNSDNDIYIFDSDEEWNLFKRKYGNEALKVLKDSIFVGDSHADRLLRPIISYLTCILKPRKTLRRLELEINQAMTKDKKYIVIYTGNNDCFENTDIKEYEYEYRYIHDLFQISDATDIFICSYFANNKNSTSSNGKEYDDVIMKICNEYDDFHYIDFKPIYDTKYILSDNHLDFRFNIQAIETMIKVMNETFGNEVKIYEDIDIVAYNENKLLESINQSKGNYDTAESETVNDINVGNSIIENVNLDLEKTIKMGKWEGNDIEWEIIDRNDDECILLSKYIYLCKPYNETQKSVTWEQSTLRKYLNGEFKDKAFSDEEKSRIIESYIENDDNEATGQKGGNKTLDYVYIPSIKDLEKYFGKNYDEGTLKKLSAKAININDGIFKNNTEGAWYRGNSPYWLRTPGLYDDDASYVNFNGEIINNGVKVSFDKNGVRLMIKVRGIK